MTCNGDNSGKAILTASGGTGALSYLWSNGATSKDLTGISANSYSVTVTDANGCTATASVVITEPTKVIATIVGTNLTCNGDKSGKAILTASGGTGALSYLWSNGATSKDLTGISANSYSVTVTDANGCTATASVVITEPTKVIASIAGTNLTCNGDKSGKAILTASGGTGALSYLWSNGATSKDLTGISANSYSVTVTDANGCTATASVVITEPTKVIASIAGTNLTCNGDKSGKATLTASGGTGALSYLWSNGATTKDLTGILQRIAYSVTVKDANGCTATASVVITEPTKVIASIVGTNLTCNGDNSGKAILTASGGTGALSYLWSNGATSKDLTNIAANTYSVTVKDANGCTATASVVITEPTKVVASIVRYELNV